MTSIMSQVLPNYYRDYNGKTLSISVLVKEYKSYLLTRNFSVATHKDKFCP